MISTVFVFLFSLIFSILLGVPIAFSLLLCGLAMMIQLGDFGFYNMAQSLALNVINSSTNFTLLAIPFFILAGEIMTAGGLSKRIVDLPTKLVGHKAGGLGFVAVIAAMVMASMSGSAVADTAAVGSILLPMMRRAQYPIPSSAGLIAAGGIIAPIIPPSIPFIIFGVAGSISISKLFLAGIAPGLMMGFALIAVWSVQSRWLDLPTEPKATKREIWLSFRSSIWALLLPVIIIGGFRLGLFTPTEAGAVASVYALAVSMLVYRELTFPQLFHVFLAAAKTVAVVVFLVGASAISAYLIAYTQLPEVVGDLLGSLIESPRMLLLVIMLIIIVVGMVMDLTPSVLILTPVLMPVVEAAGIDPVYFGVLFIINASIGLITPPVGNVLNVITGIAKEPFVNVVRGTFPYIVTHFVILALLLIFPELVMEPLRWLQPAR